MADKGLTMPERVAGATEPKARDCYWDAVKGGLMILVVFGHFLQVYLETIGGGYYPVLESLLCVIYFFHMPLFVFVSGMFSKNVVKRRDRAFEDLMVPFFVAQMIWLVFRAVTNGPGWALDHIFNPQFQLWYLTALFMWRVLLPDLLRVRFILPVAAVLFFVGQMVSGMDGMFAAQRTIGFLFFFLLGYRADFAKVVRLVGRVPFVLAAAAFIVAFAGLFAVFSCTSFSYGGVFNILRHVVIIGEAGGWQAGITITAYALAFIGAAVLSVCFLRLVMTVKVWKPIVSVGEDTMPLYILHGWAVYAICDILALAPALHDLVALPVLLLLAVVLTFLLSTESCRNGYDKAVAGLSRLITLGPSKGLSC